MKYLKLVRWINIIIVLIAVLVGLRFYEASKTYPEYELEEPDNSQAYPEYELSEYDKEVMAARYELEEFVDSLEESYAEEQRDSAVAADTNFAQIPDSLPQINFLPDTLTLILESDGPQKPIWLIALYLFLSASLVLAGANSVNNALDSNRDNPQKTNPAARGDFTRNAAFLIGVSLNVFALGFAIILGWEFFVFAFIVSLILFAYNFYLRDIVFWGNIAVALVSASLFIYIGMGFGLSDMFFLSPIFSAAIFAFITHFAREIVKDAQDVEDDRKAGGNSIAIKYGVQVALNFAQTLVFSVLILVPLSVLYDVFPMSFLAYSAVFVLPSVILSLYHLRNERPAMASLVLKWLMLGGLVAMAASVV